MMTTPIATAQMLIRRPIAQVFEAFVDPAITSRFWFSRGSDRLAPGKQVRWQWEMYGLSTLVDVRAIEPDRRILIEWNGPEKPTSVEWTFESKAADRTFVVVRNWGFRGDADAVIAQALDSKGGFSLVLAGAKVFLEHGIEPNFVVDHAPDALISEPPKIVR
ncbi:MAG TPA: SRPBCC family protein [Vicinamibacterales bacterium]